MTEENMEVKKKNSNKQIKITEHACIMEGVQSFEFHCPSILKTRLPDSDKSNLQGLSKLRQFQN